MTIGVIFRKGYIILLFVVMYIGMSMFQRETLTMFKRIDNLEHAF